MAVWNIRCQQFCDGLKDFCRVFKKYGGNLTLVEVGVFKGESTRIFRESGAFSKIYSIDPWDPNIDTRDGMNYHDVIEEAEKEFREHFKDDETVIPVKGTLSTFIQNFKDVEVDVVYIDAAHNYEDCKKDILNALNYVKPKIAICGHDYNDPEYSLESIDQPGVRKAVEEIFGLPDRSFLDTSWVKWLNGHERENEMSLDYDLLMKNAQMINCEHDPDRLELQKKIFEYHKLPFPNVFKACTTSDPGTASPACTSFKRIIEDALARDLPYVLIFEDDCYFINGIVDKLKDAISRVPDDADILQISYDINDNSRKLKYNRIFNDCLCIAGSIIFKKGYQKIIDALNHEVWNDRLCKNCIIYVPDELLSIQYNFNHSNFGNYGYDIHGLTDSEKQIFRLDYPKIEDILDSTNPANSKFFALNLRMRMKEVEDIVYLFWTENNLLSQNRIDGLETSIKNFRTKVMLVTTQNLNDFILPSYPLHPAYQYLWPAHKSDYLRSYFLNFYGGGYADIKKYSPENNWHECFQMINENSEIEIIGQKEIEGWSPAFELRGNSKYNDMLLANGYFIARQHSEFTEEWYKRVQLYLDSKLEQLIAHRAGKIDYPIPWEGIQGEIFHRLIVNKFDPNKIKNCLQSGRLWIEYH